MKSSDESTSSVHQQNYAYTMPKRKHQTKNVNYVNENEIIQPNETPTDFTFKSNNSSIDNDEESILHKVKKKVFEIVV
jgi:hypothetical protein